MMKKFFALMMILSLSVVPAMAEDFAKEKENAVAALKVSMPEAVVNYAVRDRDDGRYEWDLFFEVGSQLGKCEVNESSNEIRKVSLYEKPEGALSADAAMKLLAEKKGDIVIVDLDLDREGKGLRYEGEAELGGKRYEFEMSVQGEIIEWERD